LDTSDVRRREQPATQSGQTRRYRHRRADDSQFHLPVHAHRGPFEDAYLDAISSEISTACSAMEMLDEGFIEPDLTARPIFLVGMGRSGTSMLRLMLQRHPALAILSETAFTSRIWERRFGFAVARSSGAFGDLLDDYIRFLRARHDRAGDFSLDFDAYRRRVLSGPPALNRLLGVMGEMWCRQYGAVRWGEKTPDHVHYLPDLNRMFPGLVAVHLIRDPRDVALSNVEAGLTPVADPLVYALKWLRTVRSADRAAAAGVTVVTLRYEDLVAEPVATLQELCTALELPFVQEMLQFEKAAPEHAPREPWADGLHRSLNARSVQRWRDALPRDDRLCIEALLFRDLQRFGYAATGPEERLAIAQQVASRLVIAQAELVNAETRPLDPAIPVDRSVYVELLRQRNAGEA
jgi:hypothetical protein